MGRKCSCQEMPRDGGKFEDPAVGFWVSKFHKSPSPFKSHFVSVAQRNKNCLLLGSVEILLMLAL